MKAMPPTNAKTMPAKQNTDSTARMMAVLSPGRTASDTVSSHDEQSAIISLILGVVEPVGQQTQAEGQLMPGSRPVIADVDGRMPWSATSSRESAPAFRPAVNRVPSKSKELTTARGGRTGAMSQKVRIERVDVMGATPFLGLSDNDDPGSARLYSKDPDQVMTWLCDAWRTRFNQLRSRRKKYGPNKKLQPITDRVDERTHAQARHDCSWMAAVPSLLLNSPEKLEKQDWYAAVKRRKTLRGKHLDPGRMPRFKSRRKSDLTFACWYDDGGATLVSSNTTGATGRSSSTGRIPPDTGMRMTRGCGSASSSVSGFPSRSATIRR